MTALRLSMRPVCKFYLNSECTNPRCRYAHPVEYPMYIYTQPGIEIHPDELRISLIQNPEMASEADNVWLNNYAMLCQARTGEGELDIVGSPDYFCMPFDVKRVTAEIDILKKSGRLDRVPQNFSAQAGQRSQEGKVWGASWQNSRGQNRGYGNRQNDRSGDRQGYSNRQNYNDRNYDDRRQSGYNSRERGYGPRGHGQETGWYGAGPSQAPDLQGTFDRARPSEPALPQRPHDTSPEYEYKNVPYDYSR